MVESRALVWYENMREQNSDREEVKSGSLEHTDVGESLRQLWWTIGVTVIGIGLIAYFSNS